ncbi:MAG: adenosylcobinamide-GDP ribazoletransferase [Frankia sp.]|nr:adenosylcobinamide-GDP ribazoletransferase [Frankia sp.]
MGRRTDLAGRRTAIAALTALPLPSPAAGGPDQRAAGRLTGLAPFGGLLLGLAVGLVVVTLRVWTKIPGEEPQSIFPAAAGIALLAAFTRGHHLTALASAADQLAGRPAASTASAGGGIGAPGVLAVLFVVLIQVTALNTAITAHRGSVSILVACMASRLAITLAYAMPSARVSATGGRGLVPARLAVLVTLAVLVLAATAGRLDYDGGDATRALRAVLALLVATLVALAAHHLLTRRLGGLTEPVVGALVELTTLVALVMMAMRIPDVVMDTLLP